MNEQHKKGARDRMLTENGRQAHPPGARQHPGLLTHARPYGEPPCIAGLLLYPDTPTKMETTSHVAFCRKPVPLPERGQRLHGDLKLNGESARHSTAPRMVPPTGQPAKSKATDTAQLRGESSSNAEGEDWAVGNINAKPEQGTEEAIKSLYQEDFPPLPQHLCRRRTPFHPQPDNIAINPSLRIDFATIQRETYPGWPVTKRGNLSTTRATATGRAKKT